MLQASGHPVGSCGQTPFSQAWQAWGDTPELQMGFGEASTAPPAPASGLPCMNPPSTPPITGPPSLAELQNTINVKTSGHDGEVSPSDTTKVRFTFPIAKQVSFGLGMSGLSREAFPDTTLQPNASGLGPWSMSLAELDI